MTMFHKFGNQMLQIFDRNVFRSTSLSYSSYPPYFVDPVYRKEKLQEMEKLGETQKLAHVPIKAAKTDETCSVFRDELVCTFINHITKKGNKELARNLLNQTFENIKRSQIERYHSLPPLEQAQETIKNPADLLATAIGNCKPILQLTPIKRGGVRYQVPIPVSEHRSLFLAIKWLLTAANEKERTVHLPEKLALEIMDAAANKGRVVKKKQDLHRQCEANRAYAHYRWS